MAGGSVVEFAENLKSVPPQTILTDFLVDLVYPVEPVEGVTVVARVAGQTVGLHRKQGPGTVTYLGFRPRDDQSASLGAEARTWFEILKALGAYPKSRPDVPVDDNPTVVSRDSPYLATRFPNGTIALAAHYCRHVENWPGGYQRDESQDRALLERNPLPPDPIELQERWIAGHRVSYRGKHVVAFRLDASGGLLAFGGHETQGIRIDGRDHCFADQPLDFLAFAPVPAARRVPGGAVMMIWVQGEGEFRLPAPPGLKAPRVFQQGAFAGSPGAEVPSTLQDGHLVVDVVPKGQRPRPRTPGGAERLLFVLPG